MVKILFFLQYFLGNYLDFESCLVPCKESQRYLSHTASQGDFMVFHSENGEQGKHAPISKVFCLFNFNHRHCLGPVDVGKAAVHHRKPPFFALGSKKLLVWLPAPVREFSQSGATEGGGRHERQLLRLGNAQA